MKTIEFPFTKDRFVHELVKREGDVCLVRRINLLTNSEHWEVVKLWHRKEREVPGKSLPASEAYPSSAMWGDRGWTYTTIPDAEVRYASILSQECPVDAHPTEQKGGM